MAWRRSTTADNLQVDVNMDNVCYILQTIDYETVYFAGGKEDNFLHLTVKETADQIRHQSKTAFTG